MNKIYKSIICAVVVSTLISLAACADEGSSSSTKSQPIQNQMATMETIVSNLKAAGFTSMSEISYENGNYAAVGIANGMHTTAYIEPSSGHVIQEKNYASLKNIDRIQALVTNLQNKYYHIIYSIKLNPEQTEYEVTVKNSEAKKASLTITKNGEISSN